MRILGARRLHTLNSRLGASGGDGTHCSDHEVGKEHIRAGAVLVDVVAEVGDLGGLGLALEGARVGTGILELCGGGNGASDIQAGGRSRDAARQGTGGNGERSHGGADGDVQWVGVGASTMRESAIGVEVFLQAPAKSFGNVSMFPATARLGLALRSPPGVLTEST